MRARGTVVATCVVVLGTLACVGAAGLGAREARQVRSAAGFDGVSFSTSGELVITQGDRESLEITAAADELSRIVTEVRDGVLHIGRDGPDSGFALRHPVFRLTVASLASLEVLSSGSATMTGLRADSLRLRSSSSGGITINGLSARALEVRISSSGSIRLEGSVEQQSVVLSSSGSYAAAKLASRTAVVRVSSSGTATLRCSEIIEADVTSSGSVRYYGSPRDVDGNVTSSGRLVRMGD